MEVGLIYNKNKLEDFMFENLYPNWITAMIGLLSALVTGIVAFLGVKSSLNGTIKRQKRIEKKIDKIIDKVEDNKEKISENINQIDNQKATCRERSKIIDRLSKIVGNIN